MRLRKRRKTWVEMTNSVGQLQGGRKYKLPRDRADQLILKGYATGELSREYDGEEIARLRANHQTVKVG